MTNLLFLARSITAGLGFAETGAQPDKGGYTSESLEQMRAFAGTYYLVTMCVPLVCTQPGAQPLI